MSLLDSVDSVLMIYSYTGFPESSWRFFEINFKKTETAPVSSAQNTSDTKLRLPEVDEKVSESKGIDNGVDEVQLKRITSTSVPDASASHTDDNRIAVESRTKLNVMSGLSIILTVMSILVAFRYSPFLLDPC